LKNEREIKFRGMDCQGGWHIGNLSILHKNRTDGIKAGSYISSKDGTMPWAYEVRPETIGQYTNKNDLKGAEIYEDDRVRNVTSTNKYSIVLKDNPIILAESIDVVIFDTHWCSFKFTSRNEIGELEIIGNIHEFSEIEGVQQ